MRLPDRGIARLALMGLALGISVVGLLAPVAVGMVRTILQEEKGVTAAYQALHRFNELKLDRAVNEAYFRGFLFSGDVGLLKAFGQTGADIAAHWPDLREELEKSGAAEAHELAAALEADAAIMRKAVELRRSRGDAAAQRYAEESGIEELDIRIGDLVGALEAAQSSRIRLLQDRRDASVARAAAAALVLAAVLVSGLTWLYWLSRRAGLRREETLAALRDSEARFRSLIELSADWYWEQDEQQRMTSLSSEASAKAVNVGVTAIGLKQRELKGVDLASADWDAHEAVRARHLPFKDFTYRKYDSNGNVHWIRVSGEPVYDRNKRFKGYRGVASDVTQQRLSEQELRRQKDLYAALSQTNRAIIHIRERQALFDEVCRVAVEYGHFCLAWIGLVDEAGWIVPQAIHGPVSDAYRRMRVSIDPDLPEGRGFAGQAMRENRSYVVNDFLAEPRVAPWREQALAAGVKSLATFPLRRDGRSVGVINLHGDEIGFFSDELVALLEEMADNISFALTNMQREAEREAAIRALDASEQRFRQLAANVPEIFWIAEPEPSRLTYVSPAFETIFGLSVAKVLENPKAWVEAVHPEDRERMDASRKLALEGGLDQEFRIVRPDGEMRWLHNRSFPVTDANGRVTMITGLTEDITARKLDEERLQNLAHYDNLTQLPNRTLFYDRLQQTILHARRENRPAAVIFVDLDHFKHVNDTLGHAAGDRLLLQVAHRLQGAIRSEDTVGRLGGDEFAVILSSLADANDAGTVAQKLMAALHEPFRIDGREMFVTASAGITLYPEDGDGADALLKNADVAMYRAKELGRNAYQFFKAEMNTRALERMSMESNLRRALDRGEFLLHYQPKADLRTGEITGLEALLRWQHPDLGLVSPARFVPILEENGLIIPVGEWVLQEVCSQIGKWAADKEISPVPVAVNLSGRQLQHRDIARSLQRIIAGAGVTPRLIDLEITESVLMREPEKIGGILRGLQQFGIRLSVDDFGTGYSSLNYLKTFPLDTLKIDRSFVRDIVSDPDDAMITRAVISMAHSLRLNVVAEGVETGAQLAVLVAGGCDEMQGFYFSRPLPAEECALLMREHRRLNIPERERSAEPTLLIVDDDPEALALTARQLRDEGYRILIAGSTDLALELLATNGIGVIMSDQHMPGMTGVELLSRVKGLYPDVVRILVSGEVDAAMATDAVNQGAVFKVFTKSADAAQLRSSLREAFARAAEPGPVHPAAAGRRERARG
jgi:diguanylate cyclase (GGDEF)-like protein/PAS domain S-box-containing protein